MPTKGQKMASSQKAAQERSRRRRMRGGRPHDFSAEPVPQPESDAAQTAPQASVAVQQPESQQPRAQAQSAQQPARRQRQRATAEPQVYQYLGSELRQIGIAVALMVAALVGLTFVLGG